MTGLRRFGYCISIVIIVTTGLVILDLAVAPATARGGQAAIVPSDTRREAAGRRDARDAAIVPDAITGTYHLYLPLISRTPVQVCGDITTDTVWTAAGGPYELACDVTVSAGTLTIEAGTRVYFSYYSTIFINGSGALKATGTAQDPIYFQPLRGTFPGWGGIGFYHGGSGLLDHVIMEYGTGIHIASDPVKVTNSIVRGSSFTGVYIDNASPWVDSCQILANTTNDRGGGIFINSGSPTIQNNIIAGNSAQEGGGIYNSLGTPTIRNNIVYQNQAVKTGGGIYIDFSSSLGYQSKITNNIVVNNTSADGGGIFNNDVGTPVLDYNDVWNNPGGDYTGVTSGAHAISADPLWVDAAGGDYHLSPGSPCIDTGDPDNHAENDFEGDIRPMGLAPEIGVDEIRSLGVQKVNIPGEANPGGPVTYTVKIANLTPITLSEVLVTDTLPVETAFTGYQGDGLSCVHDGAAWGGTLSCTLDGQELAPGESRGLTLTVMLTDSLSLEQAITNPVLVTAQAGAETLQARDQALTRATWCAVQLNDTSMGSDLQAAIDASTQTTDVVKVSGYCRVHDVIIYKTLILKGGWRRDFGAWNPAAYPTTLDGQRLGRVIGIDGDITPVIEGLIITRGSSDIGGGIYINQSSPSIQNNLITLNDAEYGAGIEINHANPIIQNNIIYANAGAGIYFDSGNPTIVSNILVNNKYGYEGMGFFNPLNPPLLDYNDVWNNRLPPFYYSWPPPDPLPVFITPTHDISADPMWFDSANGDFHLAPGSPCIDAGDPIFHPAIDFDGDARPMGLAPDIGVDEYRTLGVVIVSIPEKAAPGAPIIYRVTLSNQTPDILTDVLVSDTLPVETSFVGYQANGLTCVHDGSPWGGRLSCTLDNPSLQPDESQTLTITVNLAATLSPNQMVINPIEVSAHAGGEALYARDQARTLITWCYVRLNDTPMGSDLQAAMDASTQSTDVVKVSGYCRAHDLSLNKSLTLQGGWGYDFGVQDPAMYTTTLDGQQLGRVIQIDGEVAPTIEGFIIRGGYYNNEGSGYGGAILNTSGSPIIQNNTFTDNWVGHGGGYGGAISTQAGNPLIQNNSFIKNLGNVYEIGYGGALYIRSGNPIVQNNTFMHNDASHGGGICIESGQPLIQYNLFIQNSGVSGGGLFNQSGSPSIQGNTFQANTAAAGGAISNIGPAVIQNNLFSENVADGYGGAINANAYVEQGDAFFVIQNNIFTGNSAFYGGGIIYEENLVGNPDNIIQNNTFFTNRAQAGGGLYVNGHPVIRSNIIVNNSANVGGGIYNEIGSPTLSYNDVWNNTGGDYYGVHHGAHDISSNPHLVDPANGNFHLTSNSPCINKADPVNFPPTDFEGQARPHGPAPDIGADEYYAN